MHTIEDVFAPLIGLPAWRVTAGVGSFLTMEFGNPHLEIREPIKSLKNRGVYPKGEWHFWIYCCDWKAYIGNGQYVTSEEDRASLQKVASFFDGQILLSAKLDTESVKCTFSFDLGGVIELTPYLDGEANEMWLLYHSPDVWTCTNEGEITRGNIHDVPS